MFKNELSLVTDLDVIIENRPQTVIVSVQYYPKINHYYISALTDTGFELCSDNGYFNYFIEGAKDRLRSELSKANVMLDVLESLERSVIDVAKDVILTERTVTGRISTYDVYLSGVLGVLFTQACNIYSSQSGLVLSWYSHDVFKQGPIELIAYRDTEGYLKFKANENALYDLSKLQALHDSDAFQNSKYAFFNYNECRRLLGLAVTGNL